MEDIGEATHVAGWRPDPYKQFELRYFDGARWTEHVFSDGLQSTSPLDIPPPPTKSPVATRDRRRLFDRPLASDPILWIGVVLAVLGFIAAMFAGDLSAGDSSASPEVAAIDGLLGAGIWFLLGGVLPAAVRRVIRRRA